MSRGKRKAEPSISEFYPSRHGQWLSLIYQLSDPSLKGPDREELLREALKLTLKGNESD